MCSVFGVSFDTVLPFVDETDQPSVRWNIIDESVVWRPRTVFEKQKYEQPLLTTQLVSSATIPKSNKQLW